MWIPGNETANIPTVQDLLMHQHFQLDGKKKDFIYIMAEASLFGDPYFYKQLYRLDQSMIMNKNHYHINVHHISTAYNNLNSQQALEL